MNKKGLVDMSRNKNSHIVSRVTRAGALRTETRRRDDGSDDFAISTYDGDSSMLYMDLEGGFFKGGRTIRLSGRQARSLYTLLKKHFTFTSKPT